jgi:hypothetical protein
MPSHSDPHWTDVLDQLDEAIARAITEADERTARVTARTATDSTPSTPIAMIARSCSLPERTAAAGATAAQADAHAAALEAELDQWLAAASGLLP